MTPGADMALPVTFVLPYTPTEKTILLNEALCVGVGVPAVVK